MNKLRFVILAFIAGFLGLISTSNALAQATRTWVSGVGDDVNPCSRTAPCKTFAGAISKTAAKGEISVLDPGGFGAVTITKSITIDGGGGAGFGSILNSLSNGVIINALGTDTVTLRNLSIDGAGNGINGVRILSAGKVFIENCQIFGNAGAWPNGRGISDERTTGGKLFVDNTIIRNNSQFGIVILPASGATAIGVTLRGVRLLGNEVAGLAASNGSDVVLTNSLLSGNTTYGLLAESPAGTTKVFVADTTISGNGTGLRVGAGSPIVRIANNVITDNAVGVSPGTISIVTHGANKISGNGAGNGPFAPAFTDVGTQ